MQRYDWLIYFIIIVRFTFCIQIPAQLEQTRSSDPIPLLSIMYHLRN
jgi:hypothetical protein